MEQRKKDAESWYSVELKKFLDTIEENHFGIAGENPDIANEIRYWTIHQYNVALVNWNKKVERHKKASKK